MFQTSPDRSQREVDTAYALVELQQEALVFDDELKSAARVLAEIRHKYAETSEEATEKRNDSQPKPASPTDSLLLTDDNRETTNNNEHSMSYLTSQNLGKTLGKQSSFERAEDAIRSVRRHKSDLLPVHKEERLGRARAHTEPASSDVESHQHLESLLRTEAGVRDQSKCVLLELISSPVCLTVPQESPPKALAPGSNFEWILNNGDCHVSTQKSFFETYRTIT